MGDPSLSQFVPDRDLPRLSGSVHVDDPLVPAAPELEGDVLQLLDEPPVYQYVDAGQHPVRCLAPGIAAVMQQLVLQTEAGEAPDGLMGVLLPYLPQQGQQLPLVLRLEGLAAQHGQAVDKRLVQLGEDLRLRLIGKGLAVVEVPRLGLEAVGTVVGAAGDEQRHPHADPIGDITFFQLSVVHSSLLWQDHTRSLPINHEQSEKGGRLPAFFALSLQMQHAVLDLLRAALVPELGADIAAGAAGHVHLILIGVAALGALPDQLAVLLHDLDLTVPATDLAIVALGIQLGIDDVVVDELHDLQHRVQIVLHVRHLHIADGAAGGQMLELCLKLQLFERVDRLRHMDVVAVGDIALVSDALHHAEPLLQALGELVGGGLQRRAVQGEVDVVLGLPLLTGGVQRVHDLQGEGSGAGIGVGLAGHVLHALVKAGVAQRDGG